jgi:3-deoxy-D-manno-octulosonic-acid transferase
MGELQKLYAASDLAFVGGSFVAVGGHNLLEPCAVGVPVLFGPHMFHFDEISGMAIDSGAGSQVADSRELIERVTMYFDQPAIRSAAGDSARELVAANSGSVERTLELIADTLRWSESEAGRADAVAALHD